MKRMGALLGITSLVVLSFAYFVGVKFSLILSVIAFVLFVLSSIVKKYRKAALHAGVAEDVGGLVLSDRHGLDTRAVDLREVGGVVDDEADVDGGITVGRAQLDVAEVVRTVIHDEELQHQRGSTHDGDVGLRESAHDAVFRHTPEGHQQAQRQAEQQGDGEDLDRNAKTLQ